jgi:hypothetical protein
MAIFEQLNTNIRICDNRIKLLKKYNQNLWNVYRQARKKEKYASLLLQDHLEAIRVIAVLLAIIQGKVMSAGGSVVGYEATFTEAKGDWGSLAESCLKARKRASSDIVKFTARKHRDKIFLKSMAESLRRRSSWVSSLPSPRVSPNEVRGPLGRSSF